jgi:glycosyltransferase involved in cell wall biosynthesis
MSANGARLRIAQIGSRGIPGHPGGVERVVEAIGPRLVKLGHDFCVYCASWSSYREPQYKGVRLRYVRSIRSKYFDTFVRSLLATLAEVFSSSDIVHLHGSGSAPLALLLRLRGKKVVVTIHGLDWQRRKWNVFGHWFLRFGEWAAAKLPNRTVVVGSTLKGIIDARYGTNVTFIANGVEQRPIRAPDKIKKYGVAARDYLLYLGRLVPEKQCHVLIQAFRGLRRKAGMKLVIAGATWHSADYLKTLRQLAGDDPSIVFTGEVDETTLEELYSNCFAYVLPSEVEGMSLALLDAMAFGTCVVASDIPANSEVVQTSGVLFKTGNAADLTDKLAALIDNPATAARLRVAARERVDRAYDWDVIAQQWDDLYRSML